jgi:hypothetical protein
MSWIADNIQWVMIVGGLLTLTMIYAAVAPRAALRANFGETLEGPLAEIVVRNWGALIALVGVMLLYGAYDPAVRTFALAIAASSKVIFIALVLSQGGRYLKAQAGLAVVVDLAMVALFAWYLFAPAALPR